MSTETNPRYFTAHSTTGAMRPMNTDKAEILGKPVEASTNVGVTTGVHGADTQGVDGRRMDEAMTGVADPVQNTGDDDIEAEGGDESANEDEAGPDPFEE